MSPRPAVFLDRDGTLHRELERPPTRWDDIELFPGVERALADLVAAGFVLVLVTNQSAVAAGEVGFDELERLHSELARRLPLRAAYFCPHHPERGVPPYRRACECRKPRSGLLARACAEHDLDPSRSWIVGDARRDLEAGLALGARAILVATGKGARERASLPPGVLAAVPFEPDITAAAARILREGGASAHGR